MIKKLKYLLTFSLVSCFCFNFSQTYNFKNYNTQDGLPQSQVLAVFQDSKGYVWFGTNTGGVGKFDGNKFEQININDGLLNNDVYSIIETASHEIIFGTSKGISVYKNFEFTNYNNKSGLGNSYVYRLMYDKNKTWICTQKGVYIFQNNKITPFNKNETLNNSAIYSMFIDSNDNIWFGTMQNGVVFYDHKTEKFKEFNTANGLLNNFIFSFAERSNGNILVGTQTGLNSIDKAFTVQKVTEIPSQENISFSNIIKNEGDEFYFSTFAEGIFSYNFTTKVRKGYYNSSNGLTNTPILSLIKDRENNLWIGTNGAGVFKYSSAKFVYYTKQNGLDENYINAVSEDSKGNIWLALNTNGLAKINGSSITKYKNDFKSKNVINDNNVTAILPVENGNIYFGTEQGVCLFENEKFHSLLDPLIQDKYINTLYKDSKGILWIGTNVGIYTYDGIQIKEEKELNDLMEVGTSIITSFILEDSYGRILIGSENGLIQLEGKKITLFNDKNKFVSARTSCAVIDSRKNLWLGTSDGLYVYKNSTFSRISKKNRFTSGFINFLQIDKNNNLYIGSNNGIDVLNLESFYESKDNFKHFGKDDGLLNLESNANASYMSKSGKLLVGTIAGLEIYDPSVDLTNNKEALLNITGVKLFFGLEDVMKYSDDLDTLNLLPKNLVLPFSKNNLTFKYVGVSLVAPEKVKYKYKLEGLDNSWTPEISKTEATYPSLPPGSYTFMVISMNNDGIWNKIPTSFAFEILPPWYKTWWFYTLCSATLIGSVFAYNSFKTKKLKADKQKLEKQVDERTKELREEKEKVEVINKEVIQQKAEIENKNVEITDSIKYAKNIQEALLPSLKETEQALKDCFILYLPKDIVSGDFFWHLDHNNIQFIAAADCTGHGVPGAFMSIVGNNLLNEITNQRNMTEPGDILLELHKGVKIALNQNSHESERRDGMDIALCAIYKDKNILEYSGANRPLWIFRKDKGNELEVIKPNKFPIGGIEFEEKRVYVNHKIEYAKGDTIYIFSDGFADQFGGPRGKKFMLSNMQKLLHENVNNPIEVQRKNISEAFVTWKSNLEQIDDVLVIGIKL